MSLRGGSLWRTGPRSRFRPVFFRALTLVALLAPAERGICQQPSAAAVLRIVVVEGEDAVNVVQQKTAVAPVIEVRDRNDQPVAGAVVRFAIRNGRATFGGARTLTVTTNAAGRAVATGFAPTGSGALQISATAAFQGQSAAAVTIAQTNVLTTAQATAVSSAGGASDSSGAAGASSGGASAGGGVSGTTIGIVGGAAIGGVVAAKELGGLGGPRGDKDYNGDFAGPLFSNARLVVPCVQRDEFAGHLKMTINEANGSITGTAHFEGTVGHSPGTCNPNDPTIITDRHDFGNNNAPVSGTAANLTFNETQTSSYSNNVGGIGTFVFTATFAGSFDGTQIIGTLVLTQTFDDNNGTFFATGTASYSVTLR